jgi:hypothetical protein
MPRVSGQPYTILRRAFFMTNYERQHWGRRPLGAHLADARSRGSWAVPPRSLEGENRLPSPPPKVASRRCACNASAAPPHMLRTSGICVILRIRQPKVGIQPRSPGGDDDV